MPPASIIAKTLFGPASFEEGEEYFQFRYQFLVVLLLSGVLTSGLFAAMSLAGLNPLHRVHVIVSLIHAGLSAVLMLALRGRKGWYVPVAWAYLASCIGIFMSALLYVTTDEFRLVWFVINLAGVYILLGRGPGIATTMVSMVCVTVGNAYLVRPVSPNAMATFYVAMTYASLFFYVYSGRSFSFYLRLVEANFQLKEMASRDPLTGLLNARTYYGLCDRLIQATHRSGSPYSVLFIDLDHFKAVNDTHGHDAGDSVLKAVAACLTAGSRRSDLLGRIGGEEFSLFLPETELSGALALGEKLRTDIEQLEPWIGTRRLKITASIGAAVNGDRLQTIAHIQREADQAMYRAKAAGRNRVTSL